MIATLQRCRDRRPLRLGAPGPESGVALIMVLIFTVLLYVLVAELVVTARMARLTGENDALLARMRNHMVHTLSEVEDQLRDDLASAAAAEGEDGGLGGVGGDAPGGLGGLSGALGGAGGEGEEGEDEQSTADSSQDAWFEPTGYAADDLTTYVWVEDENRKFNILSLVSPDQEFAQESKQRFVRLVDYLREESQFDVTSSTGEAVANTIIDWLNSRGRTEQLPRPPLKSDDEENQVEISVPMHLDELLLLRDIDPDLYYDKVLDGKLIPGLESALTIWTSLKTDPGDPDEQPQGADPAAAPDGLADAGADGAEQPIGQGIRININTASRAVLRCLFSESEVPDSMIEAMLRYRNEEVEEDPDAGFGDVIDNSYSDLELGTTVKRKIFETLEDLDELPEFENLPNPEVKQRFKELTTTQSDVFSVHMAALFKRNEERRAFVLTRARSILVRLDGEEAELHPLVLLEERQGLRVMPVDFADEWSDLDYGMQLDEMDEFAREERRWNPFFLEFYRPDDQTRR
ncbi:MAG: hypothetical protein AAF628_13525 [Planctomycetota bacterium]